MKQELKMKGLSETQMVLVLCSVVLAENHESRSSLIQSWNTKMYPVWHHRDPRFKSSWTGGELQFNIQNDAPTLTGAKVNFSIEILLPANQVAAPDGHAVWRTNCFVNGSLHRKGEPVYPERPLDDDNVLFPDGSPLSKPGDTKPPFVFVWKTCGRYWQVSDGPSSSLTVGTDEIPLGSYLMEVVIYHYRKRDRFIPVGFASTRFSITDQIPFAVTLTQVNDQDELDQKFVQNRAVAFTVALHDPSSYLLSSDITYNWDFGDGSGTVISRELSVTHTFTRTGSFKPHVVIQAAIPDPSCFTPPSPSVSNPATEPHQSEDLTGAGISSGTASDQDTDAVVMETLPYSERDCVIYRYGSFSTEIQIVEGIGNVQIVQADGAFVLDVLGHTPVDFTVTCQGSLPTEVCTVVSDADCLTPHDTVCDSVRPSSECQLVLHHFFEQTGTFCVNVSLKNEFRMSVSSAKVIVMTGFRLPITGIVLMVLGIFIVASAVGTVAFTYKHLRSYQLLPEISGARTAPSSVSTLIWSLVNRQKHSGLPQ